jgi:hypothetical protein
LSFQDSGTVDIHSMFGPRFDRINLFYSSPEYYTQYKFQETKEAHTLYDVSLLSVKEDDFFPYSNCEHCFWTGYFTSRPGLKRLERVASSFLLAARQIESLIDYTEKPDPFECESGLHELEDAVGVLQHHDGVSGTARQHVANDYAKRVQDGLDRVETCTVRKLKRIFLGANASDFLTDLSYCQLLNETTCAVSQVRKNYQAFSTNRINENDRRSAHAVSPQRNMIIESDPRNQSGSLRHRSQRHSFSPLDSCQSAGFF